MHKGDQFNETTHFLPNQFVSFSYFLSTTRGENCFSFLTRRHDSISGRKERVNSQGNLLFTDGFESFYFLFGRIRNLSERERERIDRHATLCFFVPYASF